MVGAVVGDSEECNAESRERKGGVLLRLLPIATTATRLRLLAHGDSHGPAKTTQDPIDPLKTRATTHFGGITNQNTHD